MQQIYLKIHNEEVMIKLLWMLKHFETQEVELEYSFTKEKPTNKQYTNEYVKKHWREFIMSTGNNDYYKSEEYKLAKTPAYIDIDFDDLEDCQVIASATAINAKVITRDKGMLRKYPTTNRKTNG